MPDYCRTQPCNNCPYRKDAPLRHWSQDEFIDLVAKDNDYLGTTYGCHKNDGHVCVGWLMDQDTRGFPSIKLRISLGANSVTREYLDKLHCKSEIFKTIKEMVVANSPKLKQLFKKP